MAVLKYKDSDGNWKSTITGISNGSSSSNGSHGGTYAQPDEPIDAPVGSWWIDTDEESGVSDVVSIEKGGTGATTAEQALANLGGLPTSGGTMTGNINLPPEAKIVMSNNNYGIRSYYADGITEGNLLGRNTANNLWIGEANHGEQGDAFIGVGTDKSVYAVRNDVRTQILDNGFVKWGSVNLGAMTANVKKTATIETGLSSIQCLLVSVAGGYPLETGATASATGGTITIYGQATAQSSSFYVYWFAIGTL